MAKPQEIPTQPPERLIRALIVTLHANKNKPPLKHDYPAHITIQVNYNNLINSLLKEQHLSRQCKTTSSWTKQGTPNLLEKRPLTSEDSLTLVSRFSL